MRHRVAGRKLNRSPAHRRALFRNLVTALLEHEQIRTRLACEVDDREPSQDLGPTVRTHGLPTIGSKRPHQGRAHLRVRMRDECAAVRPAILEDADERPGHLDPWMIVKDGPQRARSAALGADDEEVG